VNYRVVVQRQRNRGEFDSLPYNKISACIITPVIYYAELITVGKK